MKREAVKRKHLQKMIRAEYKKFKGHKKIKLGKVFRLDAPDEGGCNWSIAISREADWQLAANHIRPFIIALREHYLLVDESY